MSDIVNGLIGHDVEVSGVRDADVTKVAETLCQCLGHVGDESAGPGAKTLGVAEFSNLLETILESAAHLSETSCGIKSFEFAAGHRLIRYSGTLLTSF